MRQPPEPIVGDAVCMTEASGESFRYALYRRWMRTEPMILWVVFNPMEGDATINDPAIKRMVTLSWRWGYGGLLVVSLYPLQARSVDTVVEWRRNNRNTEQWSHFEESARRAAVLADEFRCATRVAAWGRLDPDGRDDLDEWLEHFESKPPAWCLGVNMLGDPLQPAGRGTAALATSPLNDPILAPFEYPVGIAHGPEERQKRIERRAKRIRRTIRPEFA
jgi:hypothetical protein